MDSRIPSDAGRGREMPSRRAGATAVEVIENCSLPPALKAAIQDFVRMTRWQGRRAVDLASAMIDDSTIRLRNGVSESDLEAQWKQRSPLYSFLRWKDPSLIGLHRLPTTISDYIIDVCRRVRLRTAEQQLVARQLLAKFESQLGTGLTAQQVLLESGSAFTVAKSMRRSALKARPLSWHAFNRSCQLMEVLFVLFFIWWLWLFIRFQISKPKIAHDFIGNLDKRALAIPEAERAWPLYAQALEELTFWKSFEIPLKEGEEAGRDWRTLVIPAEKADIPIGIRLANRRRNHRLQSDGKLFRMDWAQFDLAVRQSSRGSKWSVLLRLLENNAKSVELTIEGSQRPHLGFVYRDPANRRWFQGTDSDYHRFCRSTESPLIGVSVPHVFAIQVLQNLLSIETERARIEGDSDRVVRTITASLKLAIQSDLADGLSSVSQVGIRYACRSWNALRTIVHDDPSFFSNQQLTLLASVMQDIRTHEVWSGVNRNEWRDLADDLLQRIYTDNGVGDGQLTADGWKLLLDLDDDDREIDKSWEVVDAHRDPTTFRFTAEGSFWSGLMISRHQVQQILEQYRELESIENQQPMWEMKLDTVTPASRYLHNTVASWSHQLQRRPLVVLQPVITMSDRRAEHRVFRECALMQLDATMIACALELYHRQHRAWPQSLDDLTPHLISDVPLDRFDGKPMKYLVADGKPILYSVGRNRIDNAGRWPKQFKGGHELRVDDWRLWPLWEGDL